MPDKRLSIKEWSADERPREKLIAHGPFALSDAELIAILIGTGSGDETALDLARKLLHAQNTNLYKLSTATLSDIQSIKGLGAAKATTIQAAIELGRRIKNTEPDKRTKIVSPKNAIPLVDHIRTLSHEEFWVICLNTKLEVIDISCVHKGGIQNVLVDARLVFAKALEKRAVSIIVAHNHPSGSSKPSTNDDLLTQKMSEIGKLLDIRISDHLIVGMYDHYSYSDVGKL